MKLTNYYFKKVLAGFIEEYGSNKVITAIELLEFLAQSDVLEQEDKYNYYKN